MSNFQWQPNSLQPALATDSQRVFGTDSVMHRPVRRMIPMAGTVCRDAFRGYRPEKTVHRRFVKYWALCNYLHRRLFLLIRRVSFWTCIRDMFWLHGTSPKSGKMFLWLVISGHYFGYSCFHPAQNFFIPNISVRWSQALLNNNRRIKLSGMKIFLFNAHLFFLRYFHLIGALFLFGEYWFSWNLRTPTQTFPDFCFYDNSYRHLFSKFLLLKICGWLFDLDRENVDLYFQYFPDQ